MDQQEQSMYTVSASQVARRNFIAGFSRALGGFVVTLLSWGVIYLIVIRLIIPQLTGTIDQLNSTLKLLPGFGSSTTKGTMLQVPDNILKQIEQLQK